MANRDLGNIFVNFRGRTDGLIKAANENVRAMRRQRRQMRRTAEQARRMRRAFRGAVVQFTAMATAAAGIGQAGQNFLQFNQTLTRLTTLIGLSRETVGGLRTEILELGRAGVGDVNQLAEGYFFLASAGLEGETALRALSASAQASQLGLGSIESVATSVTSALGAWGDQAGSVEKVTATLIATVREGRFAPEQLSREIGRAGVFAAEAGAGFDELGASLAFLSRSRDLNLASTQITAVFRSFIAPGAQAEKALASINTSAAEVRASIAEIGLLPTLNNLREQLESNGVEFRKIFASSEALGAALSLTGKNAAAAQEVFDSLAGTVGEDLVTAYAEFAQSSSGRLAIALNQLRTLGIDFASRVVPVIVDALTLLRDNWDQVRIAVLALGTIWLRGLGTRVASVALVGLATVTRGLLIPLRALAILSSGKLAGGFIAAAFAAQRLNFALGKIRGALIRTGIGAIVVGIGELVYQFVILERSIGDIATNIGEWLQNIAINLGLYVTRFALQVGAVIKEVQIFSTRAQENVVTIRAAIIDAFGGAFAQVRQIILGSAVFINTILSGIVKAFGELFDAIIALGPKFKRDLQNLFIDAVNAGISKLQEIRVRGVQLFQIDLIQRVEEPKDEQGRSISDIFGKIGEEARAAYDAAVANNTYTPVDLSEEIAQIQQRRSEFQLSARNLRALSERLRQYQQQLNAERRAAREAGEVQNESTLKELENLKKLREEIDNVAAARENAAASGVNRVKEAVEEVNNSLKNLEDRLTRFTTDLITGVTNVGDTLKNLVRETVNDVLNALIRPVISDLLARTGISAIFGSLIPARAQGGFSGSGLTLVGEEGPEIVDFRSPGRVYNNAELSSAIAGSGGGNTFVFSPVIQSADSAAVSRAVAEAFPIFEQRVLGRISLDSRRPSQLRDSVRG